MLLLIQLHHFNFGCDRAFKASSDTVSGRHAQKQKRCYLRSLGKEISPPLTWGLWPELLEEAYLMTWLTRGIRSTLTRIPNFCLGFCFG